MPSNAATQRTHPTPISTTTRPTPSTTSLRLQLLVDGRMPVTKHLPQTWYATANIHFCTIRDFVELCEEINATVEEAIALNGAGGRLPLNAPWRFWNLFGEQAVFLLRR